MHERPRVLAVDLDGTLLENVGPQEFGKPIPPVVDAVRRLKQEGWVIVLWTCRDNTRELRLFLNKHEIPVDYINKNPGGPPGGSPKIFADVYLDDRALRFNGEEGDLVQQIKDAAKPWHERKFKTKVAGFEDELMKIATSFREVTYQQTRQGRRPISVDTLLKKENETGTVSKRKLTKKASVQESPASDSLKAAAQIRPYIKSTMMGAVPAAVAARILFRRDGGKFDRTAATWAGFAAGGAAGFTDRLIKEWAKKNKRKSLARDILAD